MYKIIYLPLARQDMADTVSYISGHLNAPKAALDLLDALDNGIIRLQNFPYSCRVYNPAKPLKYEYRMLLVINYAVFYTVYEQDKIVEIHRIIYAKRDFIKQL